MTDHPHPPLGHNLTPAEREECARVTGEEVARARTFGQRLRELRRERGITLREAAEKIGRDFTYLSKIENDRCLPPSAEVIVALADLLDGDAEELSILGDKPPIAVVRRQLAEAHAAVRLRDVEIARLRAAIEEAHRYAINVAVCAEAYNEQDCAHLWQELADQIDAALRPDGAGEGES